MGRRRRYKKYLRKGETRPVKAGVCFSPRRINSASTPMTRNRFLEIYIKLTAWKYIRKSNRSVTCKKNTNRSEIYTKKINLFEIYIKKTISRNIREEISLSEIYKKINIFKIYEKTNLMKLYMKKSISLEST